MYRKTLLGTFLCLMALVALLAPCASATSVTMLDEKNFTTAFGPITVDAQYVKGQFTFTHTLAEDITLDSAGIDLSFIGDLTDSVGGFCRMDWDFREYASVSFGNGEPVKDRMVWSDRAGKHARWGQAPRYFLGKGLFQRDVRRQDFGRYRTLDQLMGLRTWGESERDWIELGEVDNGVYSLALPQFAVDLLNEMGCLTVSLMIDNPLGDADAFLESASLYGVLASNGENPLPTPIPSALLLLAPGLVGLIKVRKWL